VGEGDDSPKQGTALPRDWECGRMRPTPTMSGMLRRAILASVAALVVAGPAAAGTIVVKLALIPGKLKVAAAQSSPTTVSLTVADGRGTGAGWTIRSSAPVEVTGITTHCAVRSTCTLPTLGSTPSGRIVLSAKRDTGMGVMNVVVTLESPVQAGTTFTAS
jgi:hypothetical protein